MKPSVYKITNKINGLSYIGVSKHVFKRWYTHVFSCPEENIFKTAISIDNLTDWTFEILEFVEIPKELENRHKEIDKFLLDRERFYIEKYNSASLGYNTQKRDIEKPADKSVIKKHLNVSIDNLFKAQKLAFENKMTFSEYINHLISKQ